MNINYYRFLYFIFFTLYLFCFLSFLLSLFFTFYLFYFLYFLLSIFFTFYLFYFLSFLLSIFFTFYLSLCFGWSFYISIFYTFYPLYFLSFFFLSFLLSIFFTFYLFYFLSFYISIFLSFYPSLCFGWMSDKFGRKITLIFTSQLLGKVLTWIYYKCTLIGTHDYQVRTRLTNICVVWLAQLFIAFHLYYSYSIAVLEG